MDRRRITNCVPVASGAGSKNEPLSNLLRIVCSPSSSAKYKSRVSRRAFTKAKRLQQMLDELERGDRYMKMVWRQPRGHVAPRSGRPR